MRGLRSFRKQHIFFFGPQLILQKSNGQFHRNLSYFKVPEGVQHFLGGGSNIFQGGGGGGFNCLFPIETHITCDFPGWGVRTPCPPSGSALVTLFLLESSAVTYANSLDLDEAQQNVWQSDLIPERIFRKS